MSEEKRDASKRAWERYERARRVAREAYAVALAAGAEGRCKGCGAVLEHDGKVGRPRKWCDSCRGGEPQRRELRVIAREWRERTGYIAPSRRKGVESGTDGVRRN